MIQHRALGWRKGYWKPRRREPVAVVWHTTGAGILRKYRRLRRRLGWASPFECALHQFTRNQKAGPHFVVGQRGEVEQIAPLDVVAWHVGRRKGWQYGVPGAGRWWGDPRFQWWRDRWDPLVSPTQLAGGKLWRAGRCNENTIGVEVVPPTEDPTGPWSREAWEAIADLARSLPVKIDPYHQISHSDAHPIARTTRSGAPWDPSPRAWDPWVHCARARRESAILE